jgi:hypothetical protein
MQVNNSHFDAMKSYERGMSRLTCGRRETKRKTELPISVLQFLSPVPPADTLSLNHFQHLFYLQHLILSHLIQTISQKENG